MTMGMTMGTFLFDTRVVRKRPFSFQNHQLVKPGVTFINS